MTTRTIGVLITTVLLLAVGAYAAVNWHTGPDFSIQPFPDLLTTGTLSGLGGTVTVEVQATGTGSGSCANPAGKFPSPFQNVAISASGSQTVHVHNGSADVNISIVSSPVNPCPNPNWTATFNDVSYTSAEITVFNKQGTQLDQTYTLSGCSSTGSTQACTGTLQ